MPSHLRKFRVLDQTKRPSLRPLSGIGPYRTLAPTVFPGGMGKQANPFALENLESGFLKIVHSSLIEGLAVRAKDAKKVRCEQNKAKKRVCIRVHVHWLCVVGDL